MYDNYINSLNVQHVDHDIHDSGRGEPYGVATLDGSGRIPASQLPDTVLELKGTWNAATNIPYLRDGIGTKGDLYFTSVAGDCDFGSGITEHFEVNDRVMYNGTIWQKLTGGAVASVNGKTGQVVLNADDVEAVKKDLSNLPEDDTAIEDTDATVVSGKKKLFSAIWEWIKAHLYNKSINVNIELANNSNIRVGNTFWGKSFYVVGNPSDYQSGDFASIGTTDGNCHIDSADDNAIYFNFYRGKNGVNFGDGDNHIVASVNRYGEMGVGQLQVNGTEGKHSYNESLRLNRYNHDSWATIAMGGANSTDSGTDDETWCLGAVPNISAHGEHQNTLVINRNGSTGGGAAYFFKDRHNCIGFNSGGAFTSKAFGFSPLAITFKHADNENNGFVQLRIPGGWINNMISFRVRITEYNGRIADLLCYGYLHDSGKWYNCKACMNSDTDISMRVWFGAGNDGVATVLFRWNDRRIEDYVQVDVYNVSCGYAALRYDPSQIEISVTEGINWAREDTSFLVTGNSSPVTWDDSLQCYFFNHI